MSNVADEIDGAAVPWRRDATVVSVVAIAHLVSHFFQLILAPLFPWIRVEFALSYAELGFIMTVLFVVSALGQAVAGFIVDHYGALITLLAGLAFLAAGAIVFSISHTYASLLTGALLVGLGNAVFHPVDFWLINHRVSVPRLGPAYSAHGLSGSLGWALAPVFLVGLASLFGWRTAVAAAASLALATMALVWIYRDIMAPDVVTPSGLTQAGQRAGESVFAFLRIRAIWLCFVFFVFVSAALGGVQSFSPTIFSEGYGLGLTMAAMSVTIYMLASGTGMIAGGWLVSRSQVLERNITIALALSAVAAVLVGLNILPAPVALAMMAVMGFGSGLSGPSRDMLIRRSTPPGATGRVYGVVYSGLDAGIAVSPVVFGRMLDQGAVTEVYYAVAGCLFLAVVTAWRVAANAAASAQRTSLNS